MTTRNVKNIQKLTDAISDAKNLNGMFLEISRLALEAFDSDGPETTARNRMRKIRQLAEVGSASLLKKIEKKQTRL